MKTTIITATHNSEKTIEGTIKSVLGQIDADIEYIIVDGDSADATIEIVNRYADRIAHVISEPDQNMYDAMNKGIKMATGDIIAILNADDVYAGPEVLKMVAAQFEKTGAECLWGNLVYVNQNDSSKIVRNWQSKPYKHGSFQKGWHPPHAAFFVRREVYEKYGLFRTDMSTWADFEIMIRFLEKEKISSTFVDEILVKMRNGGRSNKKIWHQIKANFGCYKAFKINDLPVSPLFILRKPFSKLKQF